MKLKLQSTILVALVLAAGLVAGRIQAQRATPASPSQVHGGAEHTIVVPQEIKWQPGPESLPRGAQYAVLEGDPTKEGPFTMRLKLPSNYRIPPHTHPIIERVTVVEGEGKIGMGREYNEQKMKRLPTGAFFTMPPGMEHYAGTENGVIIQLNGNGPWGIQYINPADDPRQRGR